MKPGPVRLHAAVIAVVSCATISAHAADLAVCAGPALGTTYRVTLAAGVRGLSRGEVHREIDDVLARIDQGLSTWREDSDASRFNRAAAGEWVEVSGDLVTVVEIGRRVHAASQGAFDLTVAPHGQGRPCGIQHVETRAAPPAIRKTIAGVSLDLGGIGPGYAVDAIGARLVQLGSTGHLVELGGEVRAWGRRPEGGPWRVLLRHGPPPAAGERVIDLADGLAVATATARPGKSPLDPRTGRIAATVRPSATVRASTCAEADAWAVAALVLALPAESDGVVRVSAP